MKNFASGMRYTALWLLILSYHGFHADSYIQSPNVVANNLRQHRATSLSQSTKTTSTTTTSSLPSSLPPWLPAFGTAALGGLLFGSDIGGSSSVTRILGSGVTELGILDPLQIGQVASSSLLGATTASAILIVAGDKEIGRRAELITAASLFLSGTAIQSTAISFSSLLFGRIVYGLGIGTAMHVAPLYIAETSPDALRGKLVSLKEAVIVGGIVLGYLAGAIFGDTNDWRAVFETAIPFEAMMLFGAAAIVPESPRWLALRNRPRDAIEAIKKVQGLDESEASRSVQSMLSSSLSPKSTREEEVDNNEDSVFKKLSEIISSRYNRQALVIGCGLVLFQQLSGQPSVLYFANRIFENAGLGFEAAVGVGIFKLVMTIISSELVEDERFGRRSLLLIGNTIVTASLIALAAVYYFAGPEGPNQTAVIGCILAFVSGYQVGFGPMTWLILSEIFPLRIRSAAVSIGTLANFTSNLLVALLFEAERVSLGESALFGQFALIAAAATLFTNSYVFETRGLSLEDIEKKLKNVVDGDDGENDGGAYK